MVSWWFKATFCITSIVLISLTLKLRRVLQMKKWFRFHTQNWFLIRETLLYLNVEIWSLGLEGQKYSLHCSEVPNRRAAAICPDSHTKTNLNKQSASMLTIKWPARFHKIGSCNWLILAFGIFLNYLIVCHVKWRMAGPETSCLYFLLKFLQTSLF